MGRYELYEIVELVMMYTTYFLVFLLVILVIGAFFVNQLGGKDGSHIGFITAIQENDNLLFDQKVLYFKTDLESTQEHTYCINDIDLYNELKEISKKKNRVNILYKNDFIDMRWECNGGVSTVKGFEVIGNE